MNHLVSDLGTLNGGETVQVTLEGNSANVKLLDSNNYYSYKNNRAHRFYGGHVTQSPFRITVPHAAHWYIAIDRGGYSGTVRAAVRVL